jgi:predicted ribosomally synthesized peptide with nif11-like leader
MSKEQFLSFLEAVNTDSALQEKLKDAAEPDAVAAIAKSAGFESVSPELVTDFLEYVAAQSASEQEGRGLAHHH